VASKFTQRGLENGLCRADVFARVVNVVGRDLAVLDLCVS
jgi:hypothetical protein